MCLKQNNKKKVSLFFSARRWSGCEVLVLAAAECHEIKNYLGLIYVGLLRWDYPSEWPTAWTDFIELLSSGVHLIDMFLRVLVIFDEEIVAEDALPGDEARRQAHKIKHAMRSGDVARLADCWYRIILDLNESEPSLVVQCLEAISSFVVWIEITTIANNKFLGLLFGLVREAGQTAMEACSCLEAVLSKKMPPAKKLHMIIELQVIDRLESDCIHPRESTDVCLVET